jgi:hypothetical protein
MQRTSSVAPAREIALAKNVHAYERIELESIREFDADHLIKDEWKTGVLFLAGVESDAKCVAFDLTFALGRFQGTLSEADQANGFRHGKSHATYRRTRVD